MGSARQRMKLQKGVMSKTLHGFVFRNGFTPSALRDDRHALAMAWVTPNMSLDAPGWRRRLSIDQREVGFLDLPQAELILQPAMSTLVLRKQDQARCLLVQAMDDARPLLAADAFDLRFVSRYA